LPEALKARTDNELLQQTNRAAGFLALQIYDHRRGRIAEVMSLEMPESTGLNLKTH